MTVAAAPLVVRVVPDETGVAKRFDYVVPDEWRELVAVGTRVRVPLGPRRVGAYVVEVDVEPATDDLRSITKVSGHGPAPELFELADWARWRWAAKSSVSFLRTASPERNVAGLPGPGTLRPPPHPLDPLAADALVAGACTVVRLPPADDPTPIALAASGAPALVLCPSKRQAKLVAVRLRRSGVDVALVPDDWAKAAAGGRVVVGTRAAAWAPCPGVETIVVLDEHDEAYQEEGSPTWHARDVAIERARRAGAACILVSPMPTLEAQAAAATVVTPSRQRERAGWPILDVVDQRREDVARTGLFSPRLVDAIAGAERVVAVLNQKGRAALLACRQCRNVARCEACDGAVRKPADTLVCRRCGTERPAVCAECGSVDIKTVRLGVTRVAEDLAKLTGERVVEVTAETPASTVDSARLYVGTEAALHQVGRVDLVAFLDYDQELLAPRYRAAEHALALVVRAGRLVGGRGSGGRVLVQTHLPDHEVIKAATLGDPGRFDDPERDRRAMYGFPPHGAVAEVGGTAAEAFVAALDPPPLGVKVVGPHDGTWQVRAPDHHTLCTALDGVARPSGRLRLAIDPPRL